MLRMDYYTEGFPVNKRIPVICILKDNSILIAYNRFDLRQIIINNTLNTCIGVWPGKINTDVFSINPETYKEIYPPEINKDIDDANEIEIFFCSPGTNFERLIYTIGDKRIESKNPILYQYIKLTNKKYRTTFE